MATIKAILNEQYQAKDGTYQIVIRIHRNKQRRLYDTGYRVPKDYWDEDDERVRGRYPDKDIINAHIETMLSTAKRYASKCALEGKLFNFDHVYDQPNEDSFSAFFRDYVQMLKDKDKLRGYEDYGGMLRQLEAWKGGEVLYADIDARAVHKFNLYLKDARGNSPNTRADKIKKIGHVYGRAIKKGLVQPPNYFAEYTITREPVVPHPLTADEVALLEQAELKKKNLMRDRDMWLFAFYCRGMRFENVIKVKKSDIRDGYVHWASVKGNKPAAQYIHSRLQAIINKYMGTPGVYLFPCLKEEPKSKEEFMKHKKNHNIKANNSLKRLAKLLGIPKEFTFHDARHTFANQFRKKTKSIHAIQAALVHSKSATTERYLQQLEMDALDNELQTLYGE